MLSLDHPCPLVVGTFLVLLAVAGAGCEPGEKPVVLERSAATPSQVAPLSVPDGWSFAVETLPPRRAPPDTMRLVRVLGDSTLLARVTSALELDGYLLITDSQSSPHVVVMDLRSGELVSTFGRQGQGPGEFIYPGGLRQAPDVARGFWVYDFNLRRLTRLRLTPRGVIDRDAVHTTQIGTGTSLLEVSPLGTGDTLVASGLFEAGTLNLFSASGALVAVMGFPQPFRAPEVSSPVALRLLNVARMGAAPNRRRIGLVYQFRSVVDIYDFEARTLRRITTPEEVQAVFRIDPESGRFFWGDDNQQAYKSASGTVHYLWALFSGHTDLERRQPSQVRVFTWAGRLVREFALPVGVLQIYVSPDESTLYGMVEEPYPAIGVFSVPWGRP